MQASECKVSRLKEELLRLRKLKKKNPKWRLTVQQLELIYAWGYQTIPYLYRVHTRSISRVNQRCGLLKDIHNSAVRGRKRVIYRHLSSEEQKLLQANDIRFDPYTYEIDLQSVKRK